MHWLARGGCADSSKGSKKVLYGWTAVQGDPDFEMFQSLYFSLSRKYTFRPRSKPSDMPIQKKSLLIESIHPLYTAVLWNQRNILRDRRLSTAASPCLLSDGDT
jgi:hypothetical protein